MRLAIGGPREAVCADRAGERLLARVCALVLRETSRRGAARAAAHVVAGERLLARVRALVLRETSRRGAARAGALQPT